MRVAPAAELLVSDAILVLLFVLGRGVVASFALLTRQSDDVAHVPSHPYLMIWVTTPAPTVRPPSRIAKRSYRSIAIGVISSISISTLSPGITISVPVGNVATPVTSVVRK